MGIFTALSPKTQIFPYLLLILPTFAKERNCREVFNKYLLRSATESFSTANPYSTRARTHT